ncbi:uncharacterized protein M421DRAFT_425369 [Didymella exigua CBS 183.55]|uniref:F-box domain-containing protein n=1 Tax=Didymella exigua CBS 183.55 TaxID=1150837 RepID=A0A6A5R6R6_9PLEO|nr:uncharacterized protein M421DRAFT_425369 [Didymella exigua CBS 183.55]KAF1923871.1 hypothetical protein M421DRAFT_425369 [Didymella exigua CBS 183.55]
MKRKRLLNDLAVLSPRKRAQPFASSKAGTTGTHSDMDMLHISRVILKPGEPNATKACPLLQVLRQYGLLESVVSSLKPKDLLALALSCKATYSALFPRPKSLDNLLGRMSCCGTGIAMRKRMHHKSTFYYAYQCTEFAQCRTTSSRRSIAERPCVTCRVTTCDECRIHCVYQSIYETPADPEELPNFSGFVLLDSLECAILSPHHLFTEDVDLPQWQDRASDAAVGPYHDQGFLDMPLEIDQPGRPEKISDVLDVDLGLNSLTKWSGNSQFGFPSPVLQVLCNVAEERMLLLCKCCFDEAPKGYKGLKPELPKLSWLSPNMNQEVLKECHCSMRSHVLDRWQCVKCYDNEVSLIKGVHSEAPRPETWSCRCGLDAERIVCMWCWGEIVENIIRNERPVAEIAARIRAGQERVPEE